MDKFVRLMICLIGSTSLLACSPSWQKSGVSRYDTRSYYQECTYQVGMKNFDKTTQAKLIRACMERKGYRYR